MGLNRQKWFLTFLAPHFLLELHSSRLTLIGGFRLFRLLILTYWFLSVMSVSIWSLVAFKLASSINQRNLQHYQEAKESFVFFFLLCRPTFYYRYYRVFQDGLGTFSILFWITNPTRYLVGCIIQKRTNI